MLLNYRTISIFLKLNFKKAVLDVSEASIFMSQDLSVNQIVIWPLNFQIVHIFVNKICLLIVKHRTSLKDSLKAQRAPNEASFDYVSVVDSPAAAFVVCPVTL